MNTSSMRIGFYFNCETYFDGKFLTCSERYPLFWLEVFKDFQVTFVTNSAKTPKAHRVQDIKNITCVPISSANKLFENNEISLFISVLPNKNGRQLVELALKCNVFAIGYVRGDHFKSVKYRYRRKWYSFIASLVALKNEAYLKKMSRKIPFIFVGEALKEKYGKEGSFDHISVYVNTVEFNDIVEKSKSIRETINLIYVGRFTCEKGVDRLKDFITGTEWPTQVSLTLVGQGPLKKSVVKNLEMVEGLRIKELEYTSSHNQLFSLLDENDFIVSLSRTEGLPKTLIEAAARGLVIISTNIGSISKVFKKSEGHVIVENTDLITLSSEINEIINSYTLRSAGSISTAKEYCFERQKNNIFSFLALLGF